MMDHASVNRISNHWSGRFSAGLSENRFLVDRLMAFSDDPDR